MTKREQELEDSLRSMLVYLNTAHGVGSELPGWRRANELLTEPIIENPLDRADDIFA